jgi:glc operon protein GlcG
MADKPILSLEDAKCIAAAAQNEAQLNDWRVVIAVVDDGGHLLYLQREHHTQFGSVETAICKAHAAVAFQRPTKVSEDAVLSGRLIHLALPGVIPAERGGGRGWLGDQWCALVSRRANRGGRGSCLEQKLVML